jgi:hypothetical protein
MSIHMGLRVHATIFCPGTTARTALLREGLHAKYTSRSWISGSMTSGKRSLNSVSMAEMAAHDNGSAQRRAITFELHVNQQLQTLNDARRLTCVGLHALDCCSIEAHGRLCKGRLHENKCYSCAI